jgi:hypothetical protein
VLVVDQRWHELRRGRGEREHEREHDHDGHEWWGVPDRATDFRRCDFVLRRGGDVLLRRGVLLRQMLRLVRM